MTFTDISIVPISDFSRDWHSAHLYFQVLLYYRQNTKWNYFVAYFSTILGSFFRIVTCLKSNDIVPGKYNEDECQSWLKHRKAAVSDKVAAKGISNAPSDEKRGHPHQGAARVPDLVCRLATWVVFLCRKKVWKRECDPTSQTALTEIITLLDRSCSSGSIWFHEMLSLGGIRLTWDLIYRVTILDGYNLPLTRITNFPSTCLGSRWLQ